MFSKAGLKNISIQRLNWKEHFNDGGEAYDFFASTSSAWWYSRIPSDKVESISQKVRAAFEQKRITEITTDVILAYGCKP